jgi:ATP-dependent DNA helicase RecG
MAGPVQKEKKSEGRSGTISLMTLDSPITAIKGVGEQSAEKFLKLNLKTVNDLLYFLPRRYEDFSQIMPIDSIRPGKITVQARVESATNRYVRRAMQITEAVLTDKTSKIRAVWFNQPYRLAQLKKGEEFYFSGTYELRRNQYVLSNPAAERVSDLTTNTGRILPIYPETKGLKSSKIRSTMLELLPLIKMLPETLPEVIIKRENLMSINDALRCLHFPDSTDEFERARERLAFEDLLVLMLSMLTNKQANAQLSGLAVEFNQTSAQEFTSSLPFKMTNAQRRAAWEILQDIAKPSPMNRLLQGDVGAGKTVVAAMAAFLTAKAGYQSALMAPTEVLASQHAATLLELLQPLGVSVGLMTGGLKAKAKSLLQKQIEGGGVHIAVGTQALLSKDVRFNKLGLVIIDEQHRFGVQQRAEILSKNHATAHLLSMTATPIPRSLQLTVYGDLDISVIDQLPANRTPIITEVCTPHNRKKVYGLIDSQLDAGHQAYVVCPVIGNSALEELKSVEAEYVYLKKTVFGHRKLGLLHGQLRPEEKAAVMQEFKAGNIEILITTTVIEVGIDVPNATVMLIEGAERFGLAQLHQLRGRVGRSEYQSYCYLIPSSGKQLPARLHELEISQDGFYLAEADLRLRGPGEIYGEAQHGAMPLRLAGTTDLKLIKRAKATAEWLLAEDKNLLQWEELNRRIDNYRKLRTLN